MIKRLILLSSFFIYSLLACSNDYISKGFDTSYYPTVVYNLHTNNPKELKKSDFWYVREGNVNVPFSVESIKGKVSDKSTILFLWEDMAYTGIEQCETIREILVKFFSEKKKYRSSSIASNADKYAIATFNRRRNEPTVLNKLTNDFISDNDALLDIVARYRHNNEFYSQFPNRTDLYGAIREGLDYLADVNGAKAIIVFTAGYSMKNSGAESETQVLLKAQNLHVPVYVFQYYKKNGVASESEGFAKGTYGDFISFKNSKPAYDELCKLYSKFPECYAGYDYKISYKSNCPRGSESAIVSVSMRGIVITETFFPPEHTLSTWIQENPIWFFVILVIIILIVVIVVIAFSKLHKKSELQEKELNNIEKQYQQDKIERQKKEEAIEKAKKEEAQQAENARLYSMMSKKNLFPRLVYNIKGNYGTYEMQKPIIIIGRDKGCDLILNEQTVSSKHAEVKFTGSSFEIRDLNSTNKVIINGSIQDNSTLSNADIIGLGHVVLTFYL